MTATSPALSTQEPRVSFGGTFASEWLKARSLRSTWWLGASAVISMALITAFWTVAGPQPTEQNVLDAVAKGFGACEILIILIGTLIATADYENHAITVFLAAVPRRTPLVLAKVLLSAIIGLAVAGLATALAFPISVALHGGGASFTDPAVLRVLGEIILFGACVSVIATSVGLVFRSTIATIGVTLGFLYLVPILISFIPLDIFTLVSDTFPGNAATNFFGTTADPSRLDPISGLIATLAWTTAWVVFAAAWIKRRNA
ncbi:ABC-2 type transport system permease protein [Microbacterium trichothecenolyticum]|uniref:ABC transporter permease n=1 Tax=Microbacterium trichothecenolyticum TaxID=69370 RepID=UPI002854AD49|nr:ABC transporter permease [Microbacterium trichothecenolyticum]MDR7182998.1 ABC-2 type transport system permease protein [Microbacterium trichothecenolyticum]